MELKKHNWKIFTEQHLSDWHGIWTRYGPTGEVQESFKSVRSFRGNPEKTEVFHTNRYLYDNDRIEERKWHYNQEEFSEENKSISFFFEEGTLGMLAKALNDNSILGMELLLKYGNLRQSVILVYDHEGKLSKISNIKEDSRGFPSSHWSTEIEQLSQRNLNKNWQGTAISVNSDLQISAPISTAFNWNRGINKTLFLPDGISISCPEKVTIGTPFCCVANWLINDTKMHQLIANYDDTGKFQSLTLEKYELTQ